MTVKLYQLNGIIVAYFLDNNSSRSTEFLTGDGTAHCQVLNEKEGKSSGVNHSREDSGQT